MAEPRFGEFSRVRKSGTGLLSARARSRQLGDRSVPKPRWNWLNSSWTLPMVELAAFPVWQTFLRHLLLDSLIRARTPCGECLFGCSRKGCMHTRLGIVGALNGARLDLNQ
ncbi:hypothetical protein D9M69_712800 [compost metagenome]